MNKILIILIFVLYSPFCIGQKVNLTYDNNGGQGNRISTDYLKGTEIELMSSAARFSKDGSFLSGWSTSSDGTGVDYNLGEKITIEDNLTLYAKWTNLSFGCKVTYMLQGSSIRTFPDPNTYANGTEVTVMKNQFQFDSYVFKGFNTKNEGTGISYQPGDKFVISSDITLYAQLESGVSGPQNITANVIKGSKVAELKWDAVSNAGSYKVYFKSNTDSEYKFETEIKDETSFVFKDLEVQTFYRFAVSAIVSGEETSKTISNKIQTGSSELIMLDMPVIKGYENAGSSVVMSDSPLELVINRMDGIQYFYTVDGSEPTIESSKINDEKLILSPPVSKNETQVVIKIIAINRSGNSPVFSHAFDYKMPKPKSDIPVGGYSMRELPSVCNLSTLAGGTIYYTLDGTNPTKNAPVYKNPVPVSTAGPTTIKAIAVKDGFEDSEIAILDFGPGFGGYEWADPQRFAVKREDPRSTFYPYETEENAVRNHNLNPKNSLFYKSLDGNDWKFSWVRKPYDRNSENGLISNGKNSFEMNDFDDSAWDNISVPSCWTIIRDETGKFKYDGPGYSAVGYIWNAAFLGNTGAGAPINPFPPQTNQSTNPSSGEIETESGTNSVGTYRKTFKIEKNWDGRMIFLNMAGISSNAFVWVNGNPVGYAEDRFTNKEFDITPYMKIGENVLAIQVFRWCNGSWIEDQDMNRHAGIFRSVYLLSRPKIWIGDFDTHTYPVIENKYDGSWNLDLKVLLRESGIEKQTTKNTQLSITLLDEKGKKVGLVDSKTDEFKFVKKENFLGDHFSGLELDYTITIDKPKLWSAEKPNLYKLVLTLKNENEILESTCIRVGFREIKIVENNSPNARILLNGSRILLYGTNMHEIDPGNGYTVTEDLIREDLILMKTNNINAIRMSHYPHHKLYYELCDEYGIYVMDEANLECHGSRETNVNPDLQKMMQDRQKNMFERDKNHASVVFWSSGNENYEGPDEELHNNFRKNNTQWLRDRDLSKRPVHQSFDNDGADFFGTGYSYPEDLERTILNMKTPMLQTEYCHNQGNSFGVAKEYINFFETYPKAFGGFIWDWVDQEIYTPVIENGKITGEKYLAFGKDWNDTALGGWWGDPSQMSNMGCNGMVLTDRTPKPQVAEMKRQYQMINVGFADRNSFYVNNKYLFTNTKEFDMEWELLEDGIIIQKSKNPLHLAVAPAPDGISQETMTTEEFPFPFKTPRILKPGAEYFFNVVFRTKSDTEWAPAGFAISENQIAVDFGQGDFSVVEVPNRKLEIDKSDTEFTVVKGDDFSILIDNANGLIKSYLAANASGELKELLVVGPEPNFFRSPVDGEREAVNMIPTSQAQMFLDWKDATKNRTTSKVNVRNEEQKVTVNIIGEIPSNKEEPVKYKSTYTIYSTGEVQVNFNYDFPELDSNKPFVAEIGSMMKIKGDFENLTWYGRGPGESYVNRKDGNDIGIWESTVSEKAFMYPSTQETGNNVETRWLALTDNKGFGLIIKGDPVIDFNATHIAPEELAKSFDRKYSPFISQFHPHQLEKSNDTYLRIIHKGTGVGGINSWGKTPLPQYRINASEQSYYYSYSILPVTQLNTGEVINFWKTKYSDE